MAFALRRIAVIRRLHPCHCAQNSTITCKHVNNKFWFFFKIISLGFFFFLVWDGLIFRRRRFLHARTDGTDRMVQVAVSARCAGVRAYGGMRGKLGLGGLQRGIADCDERESCALSTHPQSDYDTCTPSARTVVRAATHSSLRIVKKHQPPAVISRQITLFLHFLMHSKMLRKL